MTEHGYTPRVVDTREAPQWLLNLREIVGTKRGDQSEVAGKAKMKLSQLQRILAGENLRPQVDTLERIAATRGKTIEDVFARPGASGHEHIGGNGSGAGLADSLRRALHQYEATGQFPNDWRGDIMLAIFTLTRALQRPSVAAEPERQAREAQR